MLNKNVYFSLEEVIQYLIPTWKPCDSSFSVASIKSDIIQELGLKLDIQATEETLVYSLLSMVFDRFWNYSSVKKQMPIYSHEEVELTEKDVREFFVLMCNIVNLTKDRYLTMLKAFNSNKDNPIGKISSTSSGTSKFNDTPQDSGDFEDEDYTSNVTISSATTESDVGTIMSRLDELYRNWRNVLKDWTNEFKGIFLGGY